MSARCMAKSIPWGQLDIEEVEPYEDVVTRKKGYRGVLIIYPIFTGITILLASFFAVSLYLALTSQFILDWGSALVGFLGTAGLAFVGYLSTRRAVS